jgi:hypothetical protein
MNISRQDLYRIILEEYLISEGYWGHRGDDAAEELLKKIMGDKYQSPEERGRSRNTAKSADTEPMQKPHTKPGAPETMPIARDDMPQYDDVTIDDGGAYDTEAESPDDISDADLVNTISDMVKGRDPEHVSELFQAVFAQIPGVELGPSEEEPDSLYSPGAEGRPVAGFQLENLMELIRQVLAEGHYHDMGGEGEMYNALDPHGFEEMSDAELIDMMHADGMEEMIALDGEGDLANREEVIVALKDV